MRTWLTVTLAAVAAILLVVAAAVLIVQEDENGPDPEDRFPETPDEEPEEDEPGRPLSTDASINVTEAWIDVGDCISVPTEEDEDAPQPDDPGQPEGQQTQQEQDQQDDGQSDGGQVCHRLRVTVTADAQDQFFVGIGLWSAEDTRGQVHNASWVRSPEPVEAGSTRSLVVSFDASDDVRLLQLRYEDAEGPSLSDTVGPYEDDMTQEEVARAR